MADQVIKPLNWNASPDIGYTVQRRPDGGMHYVFARLDEKTIRHWREFSLQHLLDSDRLTRNLYDLRLLQDIPPEGIQVSLELGGDPSARNIRLAVVVVSEPVKQAIEKIASLTDPGGLEMKIFTDIAQAETWLDKPLTIKV